MGYLDQVSTFIKHHYHQVNLKMRKTFGIFWLPSYLTGPIYPGLIPHVFSKKPIGFLTIDASNAIELTKAAKSSSQGVASFWLFGAQALYVTDNTVRNMIVREGSIGITNDFSRLATKAIFRNNVMMNFLIWMDINSDMYKTQRQFLNIHFLKDVKHLLPTVETGLLDAMTAVLNKRMSLRKFVYYVVLHIGSLLPVINFNLYPLSRLFLENERFEQAVYKIAQYGISQPYDKEFEDLLYENFCLLLKENYASIVEAEHHLIKNIFLSRNLGLFPENYEAFETLNEALKFELGMNFLSVAIGGMVHTTANSFDWLLAGLSQQQDAIQNLKILAKDEQYDELDLKSRDAFEESLRPVRDVVIANVLRHPTFTHEVFISGEDYEVFLPDGTAVFINKGNVIAVNYFECNQSQVYCKSEQDMQDYLKGKTITSIALDPHVASFGGSLINMKGNKKSRICPGREFSLREQMMMLTMLLKNFDFEFSDISCFVDHSHFPVHARSDEGTICVKPRLEANAAMTPVMEVSAPDHPVMQSAVDSFRPARALAFFYVPEDDKELEGQEESKMQKRGFEM